MNKKKSIYFNEEFVQKAIGLRIDEINDKARKSTLPIRQEDVSEVQMDIVDFGKGRDINS